ncbi:histidine kinase, partial [Kineococcus sp. R8]|uniref:Rv3654c family TadE-like protein n=1 Tax=Kineococcus siccus TaxID=2696567 RepID=UPI00141261A5
GDAGSGSVLVLGVCAVAFSLLLAVLGLGAAVTARHRAESAADLAALAGADVVLGRAPGQPCVRAGAVLAAAGAAVVSCAVAADGSVAVTATVAVAGRFAGLGAARASARAGRQPAGTGQAS